MIISKNKIAKDTIELTLQGTESVMQIQPGQFIHINVGGSNSINLLRRPISIADVDISQQSITLIFKVIGAGTDQLSQSTVGNVLDVLIPCGSSYPIDFTSTSSALVIGGGIGVPPLYYLAKTLVATGIKVTSILGFQTRENVFYEQQFNQLGDCYVVTDDGSYGYKGYVTDILDQQKIDFDRYFSCGPTGMLKAVSQQLKDQSGYISLEERMGCGIGACYACVIPTSDGNGLKKICKDGPVFKANEVIL